MAKNRIIDLPETKGTFHVIGQATRLSSDRSYKAGSTQNNKWYRSLNFGIEYEEDSSPVSVQMTGYVNQDVYFWNSKEKKSIRVPWKDRYNFDQEGCVMLGKTISVTREPDGKPSKHKVYADYDAIEEIHKNLNDGDFIYAAGDINFRPYRNKEGEKRTSINFVPGRLYLQNDGFDWDSLAQDKAGFIFKQRFIYLDVEKETDDNGKATGRFIVSGYVVSYSSIDRVTMILDNVTVVNNLQRKVKPYTAMDVYGYVKMNVNEEEVVVEDDGWGNQAFETKVNAPARRELQIVRIDSESFDTDTYSEASVKKAIEKIKANENVERTFAAKEEPKNDDAWSSDIDDSDDWDVDDSDESLPF